jgi:hypothetical protein
MSPSSPLLRRVRCSGCCSRLGDGHCGPQSDFAGGMAKTGAASSGNDNGPSESLRGQFVIVSRRLSGRKTPQDRTAASSGAHLDKVSRAKPEMLSGLWPAKRLSLSIGRSRPATITGRRLAASPSYRSACLSCAPRRRQLSTNADEEQCSIETGAGRLLAKRAETTKAPVNCVKWRAGRLWAGA